MTRDQLLDELVTERFAVLPTPEPSNLDGPTACAGYLLAADQPAAPDNVVPLQRRRAA